MTPPDAIDSSFSQDAVGDIFVKTCKNTEPDMAPTEVMD